MDGKQEQEPEPVAISGMGCRWPGGVSDSPGLWELLRNKQSGYRDYGDHRFSAEGFYHPNTDRPGTVSTRGGFLLTEDARLFEPAFFGMQPLEVETLDASQRKLLEVIYEAFENAGETWDQFSGSRTGVFVGNFTTEHTVIQSRDPDHPRPYVTTGSSLSLLSNRISYIFNLKGPSLTIDTACSSSMYALHLAINAIRNGDCDSAIVAASNWIIDPTMQIMMNKLGALSATSTCHTFDASADGYARGEAFAALYIKRTSAALQQGSPIRAVVRGTAINANGRTGGITHPSKAGQEAVIREAYRNAGLPLDDTTYFECHGTGTPVGDPVEVEAIGNVFAETRTGTPEEALYLGSVKTNLGHTESASAIAGIMKVVLALENGLIPPSIGITALNPGIDFAAARVKVLTDVTPWPAGRVKRASINSFGYGGANGHCIIDHVNNVLPGYVKPGVNLVPANDANGHGNKHTNGHTNGHPNGHSNGHANGDSNGHKTHATSHTPITHPLELHASPRATTRELVLLPFSAHSEASLPLNLSALSSVLTTATTTHSLADIAYTLAAKRTKFTQRTFRIVSKNDPITALTDADDVQPVFTSPATTASLGFVFTGQGAQWHAMGRDLFQYAVFNNTISHLDNVISSIGPAHRRTHALTPHAQTWTIRDVLAGECDATLVHTPEVSQTVCTALQVGIVDLLASWGIRPSGVVGHSSGEMAAAYASGRATAAESIAAAFFRGQAVAQNKQQGAMLAVGMGFADLEAAGYMDGLEGKVVTAAINSPHSITLSGDAPAIQGLAATLTEAGVFHRVLATGGNAYHSHHMLPLGNDYGDMLGNGLCALKDHGFGGDTDHSDDGLHDTPHRYDAIPWVSSVTPDKSNRGEQVGPSYWRANLESPVRFSQAVEKLVTSKSAAVDVLIEIGPHAALKSPVQQILKQLGLSTPYLASLARQRDGQASLLAMAGSLFGLNASVDLVAVNSADVHVHGRVPAPAPAAKGNTRTHAVSYEHGCMAVDLPPYKYAYGPVVYHESRFSKEYRARSVIRHDLIGSKLPGNAKLRPQWRNVLRLKDLAWLGDHRLLPDVVFPAAGYVAMAVEAASRAHYEFEDAAPLVASSLRKVNIHSALRVPEDDYGVEVIVTLELVDTATAKAPAWVRFSVSSVARASGVWTEHCTGLVKAQVDAAAAAAAAASPATMQADMDARTIHARAWYDKFAQIGLGYGPAFQGLSDVEADPALHLARAKLALKTTAGTIKGGESSYPLHPASLDALFQLGLIACHRGQIETAGTAFVPIHISQVYLKHGNQEDWGVGVAKGELRGLRGAYAQLQLLDQSGQLMLDVASLRCISYGDSSTAPEDALGGSLPFSGPFTRLEWKPDIRTLTCEKAQALFPPPQENVDRADLFRSIHAIATLIVIDIHETFGGGVIDVSKATDQVRFFLAWVKRRVEQDDTEAMTQARTMSAAARQQWLASLYSATSDLIEVKIAKKLHQDMADILYERRTGVEVLVEAGLLTALYESGLAMTGAYPQLLRVFQLLGHANPNQKILELGAGTGGATRVVMKALVDASTGVKRYDDYTFTDISPGFLTAAREFMAPFHDVRYGVLNIEQEPAAQGYDESTTYDVVLASQCLHATPSIGRTLANCRKLMKPGGRLVLVENTQNKIGHGLVLGTLTGYWDGVPDGRIDSPFLDLASWDKALKEAGFSGVELVLYDYPQPHSTASTIVSTLVAEGPEPARAEGKETRTTPRQVQILHGSQGPPPPLAHQLVAELQTHGVSATLGPLDEALETVQEGSQVMAFLDGEKDLLLDAGASRLALFQHLARSASSMMWLTTTGMVRGRNADGALLAGLLRTIGTENPSSSFLSIDMDAENFTVDDPAEAADLVRSIVDKELNHLLFRDDNNDDAAEDREFSWHNGCLWVSRLVPDGRLAEDHNLLCMPPSRAEPLPLDSQGPVRAAFETPGILTSLYFRPYTELWQPLPGDWIEVKVAAVGLNWKDLGIAAGRFDANNLSSEYAGVVTRLGSAVAEEGRLSVGDRVYGMGRGHFGNFTRVPARFAQRMRPDVRGGELSFVEAATMPLVYMTAVYAFDHATHLKRGEKVLIQSATGGLGLCAIQLATARGADVFVTVGTAEKARFLAEEVKLVPASRIFSSRDQADLTRAVREATAGRGFDVILSAARGEDEMLYDSFKALAPLGRLIDVGRMDVLDSKTLGLELFQRSITFVSFDLGLVLDADPELGAGLMRSVDEYYRAGHIGPVKPYSVSDVSQLDQVLLGFSKGTHVGKHVISFQNPQSPVRMVPAAPAARFDRYLDAQYIITGGLGGLGRSIIRWMADRGARHIVVLSRSGVGTPEAQTLVDDLAARGVTVQAIRCDVAVREQLDAALRQVAGRPVKGIIHAAMSLQDLSFDKLSAAQWQKSLAAKVVGTKNLHDATLATKLDFFIMTTSLESVLALATQSAYTAANNFQELFARYRRTRGLPASTAAFGLITDVGALGRNATTVNMMARNKVLGVTEHQFLRLLEPAFLQSPRARRDKDDDKEDLDPLSTAGIVTCLDPAAMAAKKRQEKAETAPPRWYSDGRVSLIMRAFDDAYRHEEDGAQRGDAGASGSASSAITRLREEFDACMAVGPEGRGEALALVTRAISATVAGMLSIDASGVSPAKTVADYGVDSLIAAELRNWFNTAFRANISLLDLLDTHTSMEKLAGYVVEAAGEKETK
ncbi:hypothetical protein SODALDRAFT_396446 [Sodiomyces alkalinus F11]|uniref:Uncharacterized protein n=1 Tax=Sodiomyces alkalinus (strain CBS 110278 / VKM F-3762 / F11) TaxID=1314773 RepID=A0A3N2Q201_SODAK|nr:hypothetical protein SODALDRAFT_396446 [Sodiomyces alkalinus F11]ROT40784.1 hypothetical protein SODALDRAFT_396446 [Sodiomyces alkalinus F11]